MDIGHDSIKMIQLALNAGHISVVAARKVRIDPNINGDPQARRSFIVSAARDVIAEAGFRGRDVVSCLPSERLKITSIRLPETQGEDIERALKKEVSQRFGLDSEQDAVNYMLAGHVRQGDEVKNELILFAADSASIKSHIALLEESGLRPVGIDTLPCALFRSFQRSLQRQEDRGRTTVFVDVGSRFTTVVFGRGPEITFVKQIQVGGEDFNKEIAAKLGVGLEEAEGLRAKLSTERSANAAFGPGRASASQNLYAPLEWSESKPNGTHDALDAATRQVMVDAIGSVSEKLATEISLCFRYYTVTFRGKRVERAVFSGGEAYERILLNVLKRQLAVDIEVAQPLRGFDMTNLHFESDKRGLLCEWAVAVGLALKRWNGAAKEVQDGDG
jgi:type IV pilus assembly protein PilM